MGRGRWGPTGRTPERAFLSASASRCLWVLPPSQASASFTAGGKHFAGVFQAANTVLAAGQRIRFSTVATPMDLSLQDVGSGQDLDDPPHRFSEAAGESSADICHDVRLLSRGNRDARIFPCPDHVRFMDIPVVSDPVDSNERGNIGKITLAKYAECRRHNDFNSGSLMAAGNSSHPALCT